MIDLSKIAYVGILSVLMSQPVFCDPNAAEHTGQGDSGAYQVYSTLSQDDARNIYEDLSPKTRQELWKSHLLRALVELPDLTVEQKAMLMSGIGLMESGVIHDLPDDSRERVELLDYFEEWAKTEFEPALASALFANLGPSVELDGPGLQQYSCGNQVTEKSFLSCNCSTENNWCDWLTNPTPLCIKDLFFCIARPSGCGFFWLYPCDGRCGS